MKESVVIIGAGVSGLTCAVLFAERGHATAIFAEEAGPGTTSAAAGAIWFPYDAEPAELVQPWALKTFTTLRELAENPASGISMIELHCCARTGELVIPEWAPSLGARRLTKDDVTNSGFSSGYALTVPLLDTTIYLPYLRNRFAKAGGVLREHVHLEKLTDVGSEYRTIINCSGLGARELTDDHSLESHRGQVVLVPKLEINHAIVCDDPPMMYAIPRGADCVLGGTNEISESREARPAETRLILAEGARVLGIEEPTVLGERVGLRPFRRGGVRFTRSYLDDGRAVIHNYGHGGSGFTLSWGCAEAVFALA